MKYVEALNDDSSGRQSIGTSPGPCQGFVLCFVRTGLYYRFSLNSWYGPYLSGLS